MTTNKFGVHALVFSGGTTPAEVDYIIGENHRGYLGSGHLNFGAFFHALADISYDGPITFESFSSAVVSPTLSNDLTIWRNLWNDGPALAAHSNAFLKNVMEETRVPL